MPFHLTSSTPILILPNPSALWSSNLSLSLRFPCQKPVCIPLFPVCATWPTHLILLHFKAQIILGEEYISQSSSLCNFLQSPVTLSLLDPHTFLSTQSLNALSLCPFLHVNTLHRTSQKSIPSAASRFYIHETNNECMTENVNTA